MNEGMHMGRAAKMEDGVRSLDSPVIPHLIPLQIAIAIKGKSQAIDPPACIDLGKNLPRIRFPEWLE